MEWFLELLKNDIFVWGAMSVVIFAVTQALKLPIKHFTAKIGSERVKKLANTSILILAFAVAVLLDFLFSYFYLKQGIDLVRVFRYWSGSSAVYSIVERFLGKKIENPMKTEEGKATVEMVGKVVADNKVDKSDSPALNEFWDRVK